MLWINVYVGDIYISDTLEGDPSLLLNMTYNRNYFLSIFEQRFVRDKSELEMLHDDRYWKQFIPQENSGPCETYDPPFESDPGYEISMFMRTNHSDWDSNLEIFIHKKNKFFYSKQPVYNTKRLNLKAINYPHPRAVGIVIVLKHHI